MSKEVFGALEYLLSTTKNLVSQKPVRNLDEVLSYCEKIVSTQAAANKATDEREPTDAELAQEVLLEDLEAIADYWGGTVVETAMHGELDVGQALRERFAALKFPALAADRASRQVANKAEVEPNGWIATAMIGSEYTSVAFRNEKVARACCVKGEPFPFWKEPVATPPATTGASTARDQALVEAAKVCDWHAEDANYGPAISVAKKCATAIRALKGSFGASTVLTDERIEEMFKAKGGHWDDGDEEGFWRIEDADLHPFVREVAAQAGQVAVPDEEQIEWSHDIQKRLIEAVQDEGDYEGDRQVMAEAACLLAALTGRAPSPAKESK